MSAPRDELADPLRRCASGTLSVNMALARLLIASRNAAEARGALAAAIRRQRHGNVDGLRRLLRLYELWRRTPDALQTVSRITYVVRHDCAADEQPRRWGVAFDRAAEISPEAAVAIYSLGCADLLRAATNEIVALMREWQLLKPDQVILDLGCGGGRLMVAVAPEVRLVIGTDVSFQMLRRARAAGLPPNALVVRTAGGDLEMFRDAQFDLVCAVDVFPYLVMSGLAERHVREAARVLRPGGHLLILNYSYREDPHVDPAEIEQLAPAAGFVVRNGGSREFALWDARCFLLQRALGNGGSQCGAGCRPYAACER